MAGRLARTHVRGYGQAAADVNLLKAQVMKLSKGKANPALAGEILERKLTERKLKS
jgi:Asp-tRNA(Asn)/Glu-tRNA(Gln) amidotransferase B subunit